MTPTGTPVRLASARLMRWRLVTAAARVWPGGRRDGQWRFVVRRVRTDLVGDVSRHLRRAVADPWS
jgi:hypothetical protein